MSDELDPNRLVVEFINSNLDRIFSSVSAGMKGAKNVIRSRLRKKYKAYLKRTVDRHSKAKSFFVRSEPLPIYDFFVPPDLSTQQQKLEAPGAAELAAVAPAAIVTGSGGCGKTMFMRHLLVSCLQKRLKTPVFLELRHLSSDGWDVRTAILRMLNSNGLDVDNEYLELALGAGHFCLLLDGFDELEDRIQENIATEIQSLAEKYPQNWIVLSSRPDSMLEGWAAFTRFSVVPFDLQHSTELVEKLPFDDPIKSKFIEALRSGLYQRHRSFLSNPLLLSIMLLTYSDIAHIPTKLSIFYNQAYESLFQKHDALKGGFQRERRTSLDIQDFGKAFAAFCVQTYDKQELSFGRTEALEYFDEAKTISGLDFDSPGILDDSIQAVCLMLEDGLEITFAHRSFQEYFVARFIRSAPPKTKGQLVRRFARKAGTGPVMQLLFEMDAYSVEKHYLLPAIDELQTAIQFKRQVGVTHLVRYLRRVFERFALHERAELRPGMRLVAHVKDPTLLHALHFAHRNFEQELDDLTGSTESEGAQLADIFREHYGEMTGLECKSLRTTDPFVRALMESESSWGAAFVRRVIEIGALIRERHQEAQSSLNAILRSDADSR